MQGLDSLLTEPDLCSNDIRIDAMYLDQLNHQTVSEELPPGTVLGLLNHHGPQDMSLKKYR
jgi:hypothetical protein